jgi:DNA repair exonuclease SbcCD nuclease subunit
MFTFLHAADLHLDSPLRGLQRYEGAPVDEIRGATRRALENLVALALEHAVDFVLIAGDLYDGDWKDYNTGLFFVAQMARLRAADIPVIAICGNHDAANKMTRSLRLPDNVELLSHRRAQTAQTAKLKELGVAVHGRSFAKAAELDNLVLDYPEKQAGMFNIGLLHTSLSGVEGHARYAPSTVDDLRLTGYDYWALGHVHQRRTFCEDPPILFPGNLQGRHIREPGAKGCLRVHVDDRGHAEIDFQPLDVFRWEVCEVDARDLDRTDEVLERLSVELSRLVQRSDGLPMAVRVTASGCCQAHDRLMSEQEQWINQVRGLALDVGGGSLWVEKVRLRTTPQRALDPALLADGPMGALLACTRQLRADDQKLLELGGELESLRRKLPTELKRGDDPLTFDDPRQLRAVLDEIEPLLLQRLLGEGNG